MAGRVLVLCALVAAVVAAPQHDDSIEDTRSIPVPISTLNYPATGSGIIYQTPIGSALADGKFYNYTENLDVTIKLSWLCIIFKSFRPFLSTHPNFF